MKNLFLFSIKPEQLNSQKYKTCLRGKKPSEMFTALSPK